MNRPASTWCPSPNFHVAAPGRSITCVVMHATATAGIESPKSWLCSPASNVSAHYLIDVDGTIYRLVHEAHIAWHAGESSWGGRQMVNIFSIGIELVNDNKGSPYPVLQLVAAAELVKCICTDHGIAPEDVVGHLDVAPGRKTDPASFPWDAFRASLRGA